MKSCSPDLGVSAAFFSCSFLLLKVRHGLVDLRWTLFCQHRLLCQREFGWIQWKLSNIWRKKKSTCFFEWGGGSLFSSIGKAAIASFRCFYAHWKPTVAEDRTLIFVIAEIKKKNYIFVQIFASCGGCVTDCTFVGGGHRPCQPLCGQCWYLLDGPGIQCVSLGAFPPGWQFGLFL